LYIYTVMYNNTFIHNTVVPGTVYIYIYIYIYTGITIQAV
jgi:hypothetical protein